MTRCAILIFAGLLMVGCARSTPAPVVYGHQPVQASPARATVPAAQAVVRRSTRAVTAAVPLPETKPRSSRSRTQAAPVKRVVRAQPVHRASRAGSMAAVRPGDSIHSLARRYNVSVKDLIDENRLSPPFRLVIGQRLVIPTSRRHVVAAKETVYSISRRYGVEMRALVRSNGLTHPFRLRIGQILWVPGDAPATPQRPPSNPGQPDTSRTFASIAKQIQATAPAPTKVASLAPVAPAPQPAVQNRPAVATKATANQTARLTPSGKPSASELGKQRGAGNRFAWPTRGRVISRYGAKRGGLHNDGINIAVAKGAPVRASAAGTVVYAGNELRGFGNLVLVRHAGGWTTAYAHNDAVLVKRGDKVRQGDLLARAGSSGSVKRTQVHFEIRRGTEAINPMKFLAHGGGNQTG